MGRGERGKKTQKTGRRKKSREKTEQRRKRKRIFHPRAIRSAALSGGLTFTTHPCLFYDTHFRKENVFLSIQKSWVFARPETEINKQVTQPCLFFTTHFRKENVS